MLPEHKKTLKSLVLTLRHLFEGHYDESGAWHPGDLERRLNALGVFADREVPLHDMGQLPDTDRRARDVADAYIALRDSAGISRESAVREYVRESAHTWANRLLALRMMEARGLIDEVVLARADYGNRSLEHHRALQADPSLRTQEDEGLASVLEGVFTRMSDRLPNLFEPASPATALRPNTTALKRAIALLSGTEAPIGQQPATGRVFTAADALGWAYQYWNTEEKDRVFEAVRTKKAKISGDDIIPATQLYTEPYMVKFLVQNSLGATWLCMRPDSNLAERWEYFVADADREPMDLKPASALTFLDPACGSGHFLLEAFDMLFDFYEEEGERDASIIATSILERNLFGIDIDERAVQIAEAALWMRAAERVPGFTGLPANLLATNIRLPEEKAGVDAYLAKHPEDAPLKPALEAVLSSLQHADELGSLLKLEEPIEDELKSLERALERSSARGTQAALFGETPVQGHLPVGVSSYDEWKSKVVGRLAEHFHDEAVSADAGAAWFGRSAGKGLKLFELLSSRYCVVAANPPYMGSKNMGDVVKGYLKTSYPNGRHNLYSAFIDLSVQSLQPRGRAALVCPTGWLIQKDFQALRRQLLVSSRPETVYDLGAGAFHEVDGENVNVALFTVAEGSARNEGWIATVDCSDMPGPDVIARGVSELPPIRLSVSSALALSRAQILVGIPTRLVELLATDDPLKGQAEAEAGLWTGDDARFTRWAWESPAREYWLPLGKGGGYKRWSGLLANTVRWQENGAVIKSLVCEKFPYLKGKYEWVVKNEQSYFQSGLVYSFSGKSSLGVREFPVGGVFSELSPFIRCDLHETAIFAGVLSCRMYTALMRAIADGLRFRADYVNELPAIPRSLVSNASLASAAQFCLDDSREADKAVLQEFSFEPERALTGLRQGLLASVAVRLSCEHRIEEMVSAAFALDAASTDYLGTSCGQSAGCFPLVEGYDSVPSLLDSPLSTPEDVDQALGSHPRVALVDAELEALRHGLRSLHEAGFGSKEADDEVAESAEDESAGAYAPIPPETFLEEMSRKLKIHPISLYWLLKEGIESEGWRCIPDEKRELSNQATVLVLRALGHLWPAERRAGDTVALYADLDGVIPISEGSDERTLIERVRDVLEAETGTPAPAFEARFADALGVSFETWLATKFFAHHVKQFKKRPIAWHIVSSKPGARRQPAFSALVYYHALDSDLIPKIRAHYLSPMRRRAETERRGIEATPEATRTVAQLSRREELDERVAELKDLDERLEAIEHEGFDSPELAKITNRENIDVFCSIDGLRPKPPDGEALRSQEGAYAPDLNDGVRVNIAPWQKAGVLAADVLAKKDLDQAIADRARWRSDERRWCREGKLPRPGWWPEG